VEDYSQTDKEILLGNLERERNKFLNINEEKWRQRSEETWIKSGDRNTKCFHHFANQRCIHKHIWEINDEEGNGHTRQSEIKDAATQYFIKKIQGTYKLFFNRKI
jgi:hypothetical protein